MSDHNYTRVKEARFWDINNHDHDDGGGNLISLADDIEVALPGKDFIVRCEGTNCLVRFDEDLDGPDTTTLDGVVATHKAY